MSYDQTSYDLDEPQPSGGKRRKRGGSALKVFVVEGLPRYLAILVVVWIIALFHTVFTEAAEYQGEIHSANGLQAHMKIPGAEAPLEDLLWTTPWPGRAIMMGDWFRTGLNSTITLAFYERSLVCVNASSLVGLAQCDFERETGARQRTLKINAGSVYVRSASPVSPESNFTITTNSGASATGWNAFYYIDPSRVEVGQGTVTVRARGKTLEVSAGQGVDLGSGTVRGQSQAAKQGLAQIGPRLPAPDTPDKARLAVVNLEERIVLAHSGGLLKLLGHQSGEGNPFAGFSLFNSGRRAQCQQRLADLHEAMQSLGNAPQAIRLDDFAKLGASQDRVKLLRQAFYRGHLMSYAAANGRWRATARATDRQHTLLTMTENGVAGYKKEVAE